MMDDAGSGRREVSTEEEMMALGREIGVALSGGEVIGLVGPLGAGKTHLVKGLARGLGCDSGVTSPTFTLVHEYGGGRCPLYHFDFYRVEREEEFLEIGWEEYLDAGDGVVVVEWADRFEELMPEGTSWWRIELGEGEGKRVVVG
jgi:tRNA threonylcarbamoyladenosine biosynthesis protein TsaE